MEKTITAILLVFAAGVALAFDPLTVGPRSALTNDDERLAFTLLYYSGDAWADNLDSFAKRLGNEKVGERIVEFVEPVFDKAGGVPSDPRELKLCRSGILALGHLMVTNSLPFLEKVVLHGGGDLCDTALVSYQMITRADSLYVALLDRAHGKSVITQERYATEMTALCWGANEGRIQLTPEVKIKVAIRLVNNPYGYYLGGSENDNFLLANFPSYTNSTERLAALTAILENQLTPPEGHAKYEPERDRLKALPPEELVCATDVLNAQLSALLKAAEHKRKIEQVKKYAVPAGIAVLVLFLGVIAILFRRRGKKQ